MEMKAILKGKMQIYKIKDIHYFGEMQKKKIFIKAETCLLFKFG